MKSKPKVLFILLLTCWFFNSTSAQNVIHAFDYDQLKFDRTLDVFEPFNQDSQGPNFLLLDTKKYSEYYLALRGESRGVLLIDDQVVFQSFGRTFNEVWLIDSLSREYNKDSIVISFAGFTNVQARIVEERDVSANSDEQSLLTIIQNNKVDGRKNEWIVLLLCIGLTLGFYRMKYPKSFSLLFDLGDVFRLRLGDGIFYELRLTQAPNLIHYVVFALLLALYISKNFDFFVFGSLINVNQTLLIVGVFITALFYPIIKFWTNSFFLGLFGNSGFSKYHHMESIRLLILALSVGVFWSFLMTEELSFLRSNILIISLFGLSAGVIFIKLLNRTLDKKLYLFSYICTTEIIPLLFIIKVFK